MARDLTLRVTRTLDQESLTCGIRERPKTHDEDRLRLGFAHSAYSAPMIKSSPQPRDRADIERLLYRDYLTGRRSDE